MVKVEHLLAYKPPFHSNHTPHLRLYKIEGGVISALYYCSTPHLELFVVFIIIIIISSSHDRSFSFVGSAGSSCKPSVLHNGQQCKRTSGLLFPILYETDTYKSH